MVDMANRANNSSGQFPVHHNRVKSKPIKNIDSSSHLSLGSAGVHAALLRVDAGPQEGGFPRVHVVLVLARQVQGLEVLEDVPALAAVELEHVAPRHEGGLDVAQLQLVQRQHELLVFLLQSEHHHYIQLTYSNIFVFVFEVKFVEISRYYNKNKQYSDNTSSSLNQARLSDVRTNQ